jgi:hypothetical protein
MLKSVLKRRAFIQRTADRGSDCHIDPFLSIYGNTNMFLLLYGVYMTITGIYKALREDY